MINYFRLLRLIAKKNIFAIFFIFISVSAFAETEVLWYGSSSGCNIKGHSTPQSAAKACGYLDRKGWKLEERGKFSYEMAWYNEDGSFYKWTGAYVFGREKTCDNKMLYNSQDPFGAEKNPKYDAEAKERFKYYFVIYGNKDIVDKMKSGKSLTRCSNNCLIEDDYIRSSANPLPGTDDYLIVTHRFRTGAVCVGDGTDYFDISGDSVVSDDDVELPDGDSGEGHESPPSDNGNNDSTDDSDNNDDKKEKPEFPPDPPVDVYHRCPENKGSYKNDDIASCANFPPRVVPKEERKPRDDTSDGGGNNGGQGGSDGAGQNGGGKSDDSEEGCKFGQKPDGSCVKEGSGGSGGRGGRGGRGGGNYGGHGDGGDDDSDKGKGKDADDGGKNNGGKGKDEEEGASGGKDDVKGSISGGNCTKEEPPKCKGDPVQCYIAKEQWRSACFAEKNSGQIKGKGDCAKNIPPECRGDEAQCYIVRKQFEQACALAAQNDRERANETYGKSKEGEAQSYIDGSGFDGIGAGVGEERINLPKTLNTSGYGFGRSCPVLEYSVETRLFGSFVIDLSVLCRLAQFVGNVAVALTLLASARYILK